MNFFSYHSRFVQGVRLFLRVLLSYKFHSLRNAFVSPAVRKERLKELHAKNARMLRLRMIEMRGVFIKIGQFLSSRVDILPEEYTDELSKLQDQVPPALFSDIARRITEELGPMDEVFSSFEEEPLAAASLGQVHKACLRGGDCIVVKVQYPGIDEVIDADLRTFRFVLRILGRFYRHINFDVIFSEVSRIVHAELDYIQEGKNAEAFARNFENNPKINIPLVYWPFTTSKVLTLEYLPGIKITDFDEMDRQGVDRKEAGRILAGAYAQMFFSDGLFHGDPHPGNIFVRPGPEVILVDFGMVDRLSTHQREGLRHGFAAIIDRDSLGLVRSLVDMGFMPLTNDIQPLVHFVERLLAKYRDISASEFKAMDIDEIGRDITEALQLTPSFQIPNDFILFGRVVGMLNGLGSRLDPDTNIIEIAAPFARRFIRSEELTAAGMIKNAALNARSLVHLPKTMTDFLVTTSRGETRVEITSKDVVEALTGISRIGKGLILAILTVGAGTAAVAFRISRFDTESAWSAGACGVLLLWLLMSLRKK